MVTSGGAESLRYSGYRTPRRSRPVRGSVARSLCRTPNTSPSKLGTAEAVTAVSAGLTRTCKWHGSTRGLGNDGRNASGLLRFLFCKRTLPIPIRKGSATSPGTRHSFRRCHLFVTACVFLLVACGITSGSFNCKVRMRPFTF